MNCACRLLFSIIFCHFFISLIFACEKNRNEMKQFKLLSVVIALFCAMPCFGKKISLHGKWEDKKKSIPIDLPMDASVEEGRKELVVNFHEDLGDVRVIVTSSTGEVIYDEKVQTSTMLFLAIPFNDQEQRILQITDGLNNVYGFLSL